MSTDEILDPRQRREEPPTRIRPAVLWFGVLGGSVAWLTHLLVAWAVLELACISPADGPWVDNRGGSPGVVAWSLVAAGTAGPWLVAAGALGACLLVHRQYRWLAADGWLDELATDRVRLLLVLGAFLDVFSLLAITGGIVGELVLEVCG